jgi:hypothetical protein
VTNGGNPAPPNQGGSSWGTPQTGTTSGGWGQSSSTKQVEQETPVSDIVNWESPAPGFVSRNLQNSWVCIDFQNRAVSLTQYVLRTPTRDDGSLLRSWVLEGSNDGEEWIELDRHQNDVSLNGSESMALFQVRQELEVRRIRLRQTEPNARNQFELALKSIEFFGTLRNQIY